MTCLVIVLSASLDGVGLWLNGALGVVTGLLFETPRRGDLSLPESAKKWAWSLPSILAWEGTQSYFIVACEQCNACSTAFQRSVCTTAPQRSI